MEFERNNTVIDRHNVDVSTVRDEIRSNVLQNEVNVLGCELEFLGRVESWQR